MNAFLRNLFSCAITIFAGCVHSISVDRPSIISPAGQSRGRIAVQITDASNSEQVDGKPLLFMFNGHSYVLNQTKREVVFQAVSDALRNRGYTPVLGNSDALTPRAIDITLTQFQFGKQNEGFTDGYKYEVQWQQSLAANGKRRGGGNIIGRSHKSYGVGFNDRALGEIIGLAVNDAAIQGVQQVEAVLP